MRPCCKLAILPPHEGRRGRGSEPENRREFLFAELRGLKDESAVENQDQGQAGRHPAPSIYQAGEGNHVLGARCRRSEMNCCAWR